MMEQNQIPPVQVNYLFITFCFISDERAGKAEESIGPRTPPSARSEREGEPRRWREVKLLRAAAPQPCGHMGRLRAIKFGGCSLLFFPKLKEAFVDPSMVGCDVHTRAQTPDAAVDVDTASTAFCTPPLRHPVFASKQRNAYVTGLLATSEREAGESQENGGAVARRRIQAPDVPALPSQRCEGGFGPQTSSLWAQWEKQPAGGATMMEFNGFKMRLTVNKATRLLHVKQLDT